MTSAKDSDGAGLPPGQKHYFCKLEDICRSEDIDLNPRGTVCPVPSFLANIPDFSHHLEKIPKWTRN